MACGFRFGVDP